MNRPLPIIYQGHRAKGLNPDYAARKFAEDTRRRALRGTLALQVLRHLKCIIRIKDQLLILYLLCITSTSSLGLYPVIMLPKEPFMAKRDI